MFVAMFSQPCMFLVRSACPLQSMDLCNLRRCTQQTQLLHRTPLLTHLPSTVRRQIRML